MKKTLRRTAFDAAALFVGLALAAGAGELALRLVWPQRSAVTVGMFRSDPHAGYALRADYRNEVRVPEYRIEIRTDSEGYRVPADEPRAPDRASRLLAIGDSFTFGVGVNAEEAWPERLAGLLDDDSPATWSVRNGGVGGYGPLRSAKRLLSAQAAWKPRVLVHAFYVGNDLEDPRPATYLEVPRVHDGRMVGVRRHPLHRLRLWLRIHSHLYAFFREHLYGIYRASGLAAHSQFLDSAGLAEWPPSIREVGWPAGREAMAEVRDWCRLEGVRYLVVIVPTRYQVDDAAWARYRTSWDLPEDAFDRDRPQRVVGEWLRAQGIEGLDLLPVLREEARRGERHYYASDPHWTAAGHAAAARAIRSRLRELGWCAGGGDSGREVVGVPEAPAAG